MEKDPFQAQEYSSKNALKYFTNREKQIEIFDSYLNVSMDESLRLLNFYGVGGIGKTALQMKLCDRLKNNELVPYARYNMENIGDPTRAYREVLLSLRSDLQREFKINFPRFDLCWAVIVANDGGEIEPLVQIDPNLEKILKLANIIVQAPLSGINELIEGTLKRWPEIEKKIRRVFKTEDVIRLRELAMRYDETLPKELIRFFSQDLSENLPKHEGKSCHGVIFLDTYETLWIGREGGASAQARLLDEWVRNLTSYCLHPKVGVLIIISGRDRLHWADFNEEWNEKLDQQLLGGLSKKDAQLFLNKCKIGRSPDQGNPTFLQEAIIKCCNERVTSDLEISCHLFYLSLCVEIVLNIRDKHVDDPSPDIFNIIHSSKLANELTTRFLRSLDNRAMELWLIDLSLTPRFNQKVAYALDNERNHNNGSAGWERLMGFSFIESQPNGFYRLHKTMRNSLRIQLLDKDTQVIHEWFFNFWAKEKDISLFDYHFWILSPQVAFGIWNRAYETAMKNIDISLAREFLKSKCEITLDDYDQQVVGDEMWAITHLTIAYFFSNTPMLEKTSALSAAIEHYLSALEVYTETKNPRAWAMIQNGLGCTFDELPTGNREKNLQKAIEYYEASLRVLTEKEYPEGWAASLVNMGNTFGDLTSGDQKENRKKSIECYEAALRVFTKDEYPYDWASTQNCIGATYGLSIEKEKLQKSIEYFKAALMVFKEPEFPDKWAEVQNNLAFTYATLQTENFDKVFECCEAALRVFTENKFPGRWAKTQLILGDAYFKLPEKKEKDFHKAIEYYKAAQRVFTEIEYPYDWAMIQNILGDVYFKLSMENKGDNVNKAIEYYETTLRVYTETEYPNKWANIQNKLGDAYFILQIENLEENLLKAIEYYEAALRVYTEIEFPKTWAERQIILGTVFSRLANENPEKNLHKAIECYENSLKIFQKTEFPKDWAFAQYFLGIAYFKKFTFKKQSNKGFPDEKDLCLAHSALTLSAQEFRLLGMISIAKVAEDMIKDIILEHPKDAPDKA